MGGDNRVTKGFRRAWVTSVDGGCVFSSDDLERQFPLAIAKLEAVRELEHFKKAKGFVKAIDAELAVLRSRLPPAD